MNRRVRRASYALLAALAVCVAATRAAAQPTYAPIADETPAPVEAPTAPVETAPDDPAPDPTLPDDEWTEPRPDEPGQPGEPDDTDVAGEPDDDDPSDVDASALDSSDGFVLDDAWDEGDAGDGPTLRYFLEDVRIEGHTRTRRGLILAYVPFEPGDVIDPESSELEAIAWAVRGTGWFSHVRVRLARGSRRGWVDLVIEVEDRNSVVVNQFVLGVSEGLSSTRDPNTEVLPYVGFSIAETNLLGSGHSIALTGLMSQTQQAARLGFQSPGFLEGPYTLRVATSFHNGREFYGHQPFVSADCPADAPPACLEELAARNVVVFYRRSSLSAGFGRTAGPSFHWAVDWVGDVLYATSVPEAASEVRGDTISPIDFAVEPGRSLVSSIRLSVGYDRRDDPNLTRRGILVRAQGEVGSRIFGSRYDYSRLQATVRGYIPLPHGQVLRLSAFAGFVTGEAPFFTLFHVSDLTDLIPSRILEMDIDRRQAPNFFGTSIGLMRAEEFAARADLQYELALQRGASRSPLRGVNAYFNLGVYAISDLRELALAPSGFSGASRLPIDLTFDLGLRIDTEIGLFEFGFSNLLGFVDFR